MSTKIKKAPNPFAKFKANEAYTYLMDRFLLRLPVDERAYRAINGRGTEGGWGGRSWIGPRMCIDTIRGDVFVLRSYDMLIAAWVDNTLLLNADGVDSQQTRKHQDMLRDRIGHLNGFRYVMPSDPFELWTDSLRSRWNTIEAAAKKQWIEDIMKNHTASCAQCACYHPGSGACVCQPRDQYVKDDHGGWQWVLTPYPQHEYSPAELDEEKCAWRWTQSQEYKDAWAEWEKDPAWSEHKQRYYAAKREIEAKHNYHPKTTAHCSRCGAEMVLRKLANDHGDAWYCETVGDGGSTVHAYSKPVDLSYSMIPFSVLGYDVMSGRFLPEGPRSAWQRVDTAGVELRHIEVVDSTPDFKIKRLEKRTYKRPQANYTVFGQHKKGCANPQNAKCGHCDQPFRDLSQHVHEVEVEHHFLGELLFRVNISPEGIGPSTKHCRPEYVYYISGLDRNDNPALRKFFLSMLPSVHTNNETGKTQVTEPATVNEALELLRPSYLVAETPRQGEWFFKPVPEDSVEYKELSKLKDKVLTKQVPIISADPEAQAKGDLTRQGRHVAFRMKCTDDSVYVKGPIKDREHNTLDLGDKWHKVVRNCAVKSWAFDPANKRVQVD